MTILENVPLSQYSTFRIGGTARYLININSEEDIRAGFSFARENSLEVVILGSGSNTLISDDGFDGLIMVMAVKGISSRDVGRDRVEIDVGAGENWDDFVAWTTERSFWGLENLSGIPGTVGASPIQNIGAYGVEVGESIENVRVYDPERDDFLNMGKNECEFGYRTSIWKRARTTPLVILRVTFMLSRRANPRLSYRDLAIYFENERVKNPSIEHIRNAIIEIRSNKFPDLSAVGTAGSFWKNPTVSITVYRELLAKYPDLPSFPIGDDRVKLPLAWILDHICNLKGHAHGRAALYENQPLVMIAFPGCTSFEVESLAEHVSRVVHQMTGIIIEREVVSIGK